MIQTQRENRHLTTAYDNLIAHVRQTSLLGSTCSLLSWDQETMMPPKGLAHRTDQIALLAKLCHEQATDPRIGDWLDACDDNGDLTADPHSVAAVNLREIRRDYDKATKLPPDLVEALARTTSEAKAAWVDARQKNDYPGFAPHLARVVDLNLRKAECFGWPQSGEPWDALADGYEEGLNAAYVESVFEPLRPHLVALIDQIMGATARPSNAFNERVLPIERQKAFVKDVAAAIGFDFDAGRLDTSAHPFCSGTHCRDVRMTTRFHENMLNDALGSTMHETGHGIYNQGLPVEHIGTPRGEPVGLSIHESQSRLWENQVGRSRAFWAWAFPKLRDYFGQAVDGLSEEQVYAGANIVQPSLIRVEADEATYNLHILIRFELERLLLNRKLSTEDLPDAWGSRYRQYLGVDVPNDAQGCLQDIHWSMGAIGYFPTYTLGNLYAAQFFEAARDELGDLHAMFSVGEFTPLREWFNENIHQTGMTYRSEELCQHVTGKPLSHGPLLRHLETKLKPIYGLA